MSRRGTPDLQTHPERPDLRGESRPTGGAGQASGRRRNSVLGWAFSIGVNLIVFTALLWPNAASPPPRATLSPIELSLVERPMPEPPGPPSPIELKAGPNVVRPQPPLLAAVSPVLADRPAPDTSDLVSEYQLAGAASAGEGGGGGGDCDTARALQRALRRDPLVRAAVEDAHRLGKAIMLWNGDWVRSGGQDGKGLSAVREAIMWEVAFAPEACRNERVHGLVLLSLADGSTRFAIGSGDWRWADLLGVRGGRSDR